MTLSSFNIYVKTKMWLLMLLSQCHCLTLQAYRDYRNVISCSEEMRTLLQRHTREFQFCLGQDSTGLVACFTVSCESWVAEKMGGYGYMGGSSLKTHKFFWSGRGGSVPKLRQGFRQHRRHGPLREPSRAGALPQYHQWLGGMD